MRRINKILILCLLAMPLWPIAGYCQSHAHDSIPIYDSRKSQDFLELMPHVSVGMTSLVQNYGSAVPGLTDFLLSPGVQLKAGVDVRFNIRNSFGIATGMEFGLNNFRYAMSIVENGTGSISSMYVRSHFQELTVPVYMSWRLNIGRRMMWSIDLGLYFSEGLGGSIKTSGYTSGQNALGQLVVTHATYDSDYYNSNRQIINGVKKFDWGPRVATGLMYRHKYTLNAVLQVGARNLALNEGVIDVKYHNLSLAFQVGYIF